MITHSDTWLSIRSAARGRDERPFYIRLSLDNGAVAALWSAGPAQAASEDLTVVFVDDYPPGFQDLANFYRRDLNPIGRGNGTSKTTTGEYDHHGSQAKYQVLARVTNNSICAYTLLRMPETQVAVNQR